MGKKWNLKEIEILKKFYLIKSNVELSKLLDRTIMAISGKIFVMGLKRPKEWISERMKKYNPMYDRKLVRKMRNTFERNHPNWREFNKGIKKPELTKRNLENNPMKNPENRAKSSASLKRGYDNGRVNYFKGMKNRTWKLGHPNGMLGKHHKQSSRLKISVATSGENNPFYRKTHPQELKNQIYRNVSKALKEKMKDEKYKQEWLKKMREGIKRPTKPERIIINLIKENNLPFNYVGDGAIWFKGYGTLFNPDFLSKNPKHIIEVFGDYWHRNTQENDRKRLETYLKYGYKTLVIWEHELKNPNQVLNKINGFIK